MLTLREIFDKLPDIERRTLTCAFELELPQFVILPERKYIGVYCGGNPNLIEKTRVGEWSFGDLAPHVVVATKGKL